MNSGLPILFNTARGYTVEYRKRFLYSRYDPQKHPVATASSAKILPETLVLCISPLLGYGLDLLLDKLPEKSVILGLEADEELMKFSVSHIQPSILQNPRFRYIRTSSANLVLQEAAKLSQAPFRRCLRIDMSGGSAFHADVYDSTVSVLDNWISCYWKNRITLIKLGRNYTRNVFRNTPLLCNSLKLPYGSVNRPVMVLGAGPSTENALPFIHEYREKLYLLAVDTALPLLLDHSLKPDAIVILESQLWIEHSFIGATCSGIPVFADMTARKGAFSVLSGPVFLFFTEFADTRFTRRFLETPFAPARLPAMGSVGIAALLLARKIAADSVPVIASGLDFSWGKAFSHARGTSPVRDIFCASTRLFPVSSACPSVKPGKIGRTGMRNTPIETDPALSGYAELSVQFARAGYFSECYVLGQTGLDIGIPCLNADKFRALIDAHAPETFPVSKTDTAQTERFSQAIACFLENELSGLLELRGILTGETPDLGRRKEQCIRDLAESMDYLYMHFPDGHRGFSGEQAFLKRVRIEIDVFVKTIRNALTDLQSVTL